MNENEKMQIEIAKKYLDWQIYYKELILEELRRMRHRLDVNPTDKDADRVLCDCKECKNKDYKEKYIKSGKNAKNDKK